MKASPLHKKTIQIASYIVRFIVSLRYRVKVKNLDAVLSLKQMQEGVLFLPNHPAEVDPIILMSILAPRFQPRCVIVEHFYHLKGFQNILDFARVVPIPTMDEKANAWRGKQITKTLEAIGKEISEDKEHYVIYPSGQLKKTGMEKIGGASFIYTLLQKHPTIPVVLVRTTGLWGSRFSRAQTGTPPAFAKTLISCFYDLCKSLVFFLPKREVLVEFEPIFASRIVGEKSKIDFNKYLESWFNKYPYEKEEPLSLVPYSIWNPKIENIPVYKPPKKEEGLLENIPVEIEKKVSAYLADLAHLPISEITQNAHLSLDLGLDSLDIAQIYLFLDKIYGIEFLEPGSLVHVHDIFRAIISEEDEKKEHQEESLSKEKEQKRLVKDWNDEKKRKDPQVPKADTILEAFLDSCERMGSAIACGDHLSGVFSYKKAKVAICALALKAKDWKGKEVGILLPASVGSYFSVLACYLAGKTPVMLNWTAGKKAIKHMVDVSEISTIFTSKKFLDAVPFEDLEDFEDLFVFAEDVKASFSWKNRIKALYLSWVSSKKLIHCFGVTPHPEDTAVLLFTSGTETLPKAVPLTHKQLLSNQSSAFSCVNITAVDSFYGVLPPFHSFGFSLTGLLPLIFGVKVFYGPDPTDARQMAIDIENMGISIFCLAPSFARSLVAEARHGSLKSLRIWVLGAEKLSLDLKDLIKKNVGASLNLLEGYGITECGPVVTLQRMDEKKEGVGKAIPDVLLTIVDPVSLALKKQGEEGEVWIHSPAVFEGYLPEGSVASPFVYQDGKKWYRSGDVGYLDAEEFLHLTDRLKRIVKIGGEMVSLGGMERELLRIAHERLWTPSFQEGVPLAVIARNLDGQKSEIVVCSTFPLVREDVNQVLREEGFARIAKVADVIRVDVIPLTGTGKVHHRILEEKVKNR